MARTDKGKSGKGGKSLYRISEVAKRVNLTSQMIHIYHHMGLIREAERTPSGYRLFDESVFKRIDLIRGMNKRYTLQQIREIFFEGPSRKKRTGAPSESDR